MKKAFTLLMACICILICWSEVLAQSQITVPNVYHMDEAAGIAVLKKAGFAPVNIRITYLRSASQKDANRISRQSPAAGRKVPANSAISLIVLRSPSQATVPNVLGSGKEQANQIIESAGLKTTINFVQTRNPKEFGNVLSQKPAAGQTASRGDVIVLVIGKPDLFSIPKVEGLSVEQAAQNLWNAGYKVRVSTDTVATLDPNRDRRVGSQEPPVGADWTVTLKLYKFTGAPVPKVVGMTYEKANETFINAGLMTAKDNSSIVTTDRSQHGTVARQSVEPGKYLTRGTVVTLKLYSYRALVPNVVGMAYAQATQTLQDAGFLAGSDFEASKNPREFSKVIRQKPSAGQMASKGDWIQVIVGKPDFSAVPKVVGLPLEQARQNLAKAGYAIQVSQNFVATLDPAQDGMVNSQGPPGGPQWSVVLKLYKLTGIKVPNVVGMPYEQAMKTLGNGGLAVHEADSKEITHDPKQHGRVASQNYEPGKYLAPRTVVYLKVYDLQISVPNVVGMTHAQAELALKKVGLLAAKGGSTIKTTDTKQAGKVAKQALAAGKSLPLGAAVPLQVFVYPLPNVAGMTLDQAQQTLKQLNLNYTTEIVPTKDKNQNYKIARLTPSLYLEKDEKIILFVYVTPVPHVLMKTFAEAARILGDAGYRALRHEKDYHTSDRSNCGRVMSQDPGTPNEPMRPAKDVTLYLYESCSELLVPNVVGLSFDQAQQTLEKAGFRWSNVGKDWKTVNDPKMAAGVITGQYPRAGTNLFTNELLSLTGNRYEKTTPIKVPNVMNMTADEAVRTIQNAGLFYGIGYKDTGLQESNGRIVSQSPAPGTTVFGKSSVDLVAGRYSAAAIEVNMIYVAANKTYLLKIKGGTQPYDVKADYNVSGGDRKKLGGAKALEILGLKDEPSSPGWKFYRVTAKIPMKATFTVKDAKGTTKQFIATMENK